MKLNLLSILLFTGIFSFGQYTYIPDDNFEQALIDLGHDDVLDNQVLTGRIENLTSLNVTNREIYDLTGIEDFRRIETLYCGYNNLQQLDLGNNIYLEWVIVSNNNLNGINVIGCNELELLDCYNNNLSYIDLTQNIKLKTLDISRNQLTSIDLSQNSLLTSIQCHNNQIQNLDFTNNMLLRLIDCSYNNLASLDVSNNVDLRLFGCSNNSLSELDLSNNLILETLTCNENQIINLDLSNNVNLFHLNAEFNQILNLDLSNNNHFKWLKINDNNLVSLNLKNGNNINMVEILGIFGISSINNPNLSCIQVDDAAWSETNWTNVDEWSTFREDCQMSTNEYDFTTFKIFPNPTKNALNFSENLKEITIYDLSGKSILKGKGNQINVSNLLNGTYLIKGITNSGKTINQKFIKN